MKPLPFSPHTVVLASAGTGKTFQLANRYIGLLAQGEEPSTILATTFTRKAAGEILGRILDLLGRGVTEGEALESLRRNAHPELTHDRCGELLARLVAALHRINVRTIDALLLRFGASFALELGLPSGWRIMDDEEDEAVRSRAVAEALRQGTLSERLAAVRSLHGDKARSGVHAAVVAAVANAYDAYLRAEGRREPWLACAVCAGPPEEGVLERAIVAMRAAGVPTKKGGEPDGRWTKAVARACGLAQASEWLALLKDGLCEKIHNGGKFYGVSFPGDLAAATHALRELAVAGALHTFRGKNDATYRLVDAFHGAYRDLKQRAGAYRFEDVPGMLLRPDLADRLDHLYYRLDATIRHVLLDEFQDTSMTQFRVLRPMLEELLSTDEGGRSVFIVGDAKQSLYAWREAEPGLLPALSTQWPHLVAHPLDRNRRSSPVVIGLVNTVMGSLPTNPAMDSCPGAAKEWHERFPRHEAHGDLPGEVRLVVGPEPIDDEPPVHAAVRFAAERVAEITRRAPHATVAVLLRTNRHVARVIYELAQRGVRASEEGGNVLTDAPPVAAAASLLHLIDHPGDSAAFFHVATSPIGTAVELGDPLDVRAAAPTLTDLRRRIARDGYADMLTWIQRRCAGSMDERGLARFSQLIDLAQSIDPGTRPGELARIVRMRRVEEPGSERVRVMTIHKAKGLEFDAVVLPELEVEWGLQNDTVLSDRAGPLDPVHAASIYPNQALRDADPALRELYARCEAREVGQELCCLYVALTRAIHVVEMVVQPRAKDGYNLSPAGVLHGALARGRARAPGEVLWSHESGDWPAAVEARRALPHGAPEAPLAPPNAPLFAPPASPSAPVGETTSGQRPNAESAGLFTSPPVELVLAPGPRSLVRRIRRRSPSSLEGGRTIDLAARLTLAGSAARERGDLIHAWFEGVGWLDDGAPSDADLVAIGARVGAAGVGAELVRFRAWLERAPIAGALSRARYEGRPHDELILKREWPFALRDAEEVADRQTLLVGRFDRLVIGRRGGRAAWAEIIDFKSDRISAADAALLNARLELYRPQQEAYRRAACRILKLEPDAVSWSLVFCEAGLVIEGS